MKISNTHTEGQQSNELHPRLNSFQDFAALASSIPFFFAEAFQSESQTQ